MKFIERNGLLLPADLAKEVGFGCPKHDQAMFIPFRVGQSDPELQEFIKDHKNCGELETLERTNGKILITGKTKF